MTRAQLLRFGAVCAAYDAFFLATNIWVGKPHVGALGIGAAAGMQFYFLRRAWR